MCQCLINNPQALVNTVVDAVSGQYGDTVTGCTSCHELAFKTAMFVVKSCVSCGNNRQIS